MGKVVQLPQANQKIDEGVESRFIGMVKTIYLNQLESNYGRENMIKFMFENLNYENRVFLLNFLGENEPIKTKYNIQLQHPLDAVK